MREGKMKLERIGALLPKQLAGRGSLVFFAGVLGVFLLIAGGLPFSDKEEAADASAASGTTRQWSEVYVRQLEETLTELIGSIEGAGRTKVAVTLDASAETVYALDETNGGENGQRQLEHILVDTREGQDALVEMTWEPVIRGIAVVCEGADDVTVNAQITQAVSVLTGVSTNRISISKMS